MQDYDPEPDVLVIDADASRDPGRRYVERFYLAAEIVSESDRTRVNKKRDIYKLHEHCTCILTIQQGLIEVQMELRSNDKWIETVLKNPDDWIVILDFGLRCKVSELYKETALQPLE